MKLNLDMSYISKFKIWLKSPSLIDASMPAEIIPLGLTSLELSLAGWGWVRLEGSGISEPRRWFWHDQSLTFFVPVGSHPILTLANPWGSKRYELDATSAREEVWVPHGSYFQFRLPDSASTRLPGVPQELPSSQWLAAGINAPGRGHWRVHLPTGRTVVLPRQPLPPPNLSLLSLPSLKLDNWHATTPMEDLNRRLQRAAIAD